LARLFGEDCIDIWLIYCSSRLGMEGCGLYSCGAGMEQVAGSCVKGNELLRAIKWDAVI